MIDRVTVHPGRHRDSVTLMLASGEAAAVEGIAEASAVSATPINLELLDRSGFTLGDGADAPGPGDLVIAIRGRDEAAVEAALVAFETALESRPASRPDALDPAPTIFAAVRRHPHANLAVISVPGTEAAGECAAALAAGLNVFCFSSGFDRSTELALKEAALERDLLMMGPDCGTAILDGVGIGFANAIRRGPVGIVGASGTGMQQIACLLDAAGVGVSQAIGVGGRDLDAEIGGRMTLRAIDLLAEDPATKAIVVVAKSPDEGVAGTVADRAASAGKPAILCFPELDLGPAAASTVATTLEQAAELAAGEVGASLTMDPPAGTPQARPGLLRGLFCGGTLRDEAAAILARELGERSAPASLSREPGPEAEGHLLVDYGSEELTLGRPHPMIDPWLRDAAVEREGLDPRVSVLLADVVLGRGSHPDPAAEVAAALERVRSSRPEPPAAVISLCGAAADPQGLEPTTARLREAGALVFRSNAAAARTAASLIAGGPEARP